LKSVTSTARQEEWGAEKRLMVHLCRVVNLDREAVTASLQQDLDWDYLSLTAARLYAGPLFYHHLKEWRDTGEIDPRLLHPLEEQYRMSTARNMRLLHAFDRITEGLTAKGIPCIGLKGVVLCRTLYPEPALRPMFDIDVLVKREDLRGADEEFRKAGYQPVGFPLPDIPQGSVYDTHYIKGKEAPVPLELHWDLGEKNRYRLDVSGIWDRARPSRYGPFLEMSDDDTLVYLSLHFFKHYLFKSLPWLCDLYEWITQRKLDWEGIIEGARNQSVATFLYYTLQVLEDFYALSLPIRPERILKIGTLRRKILDGYVRNYPMFRPLERENYLRQRVFAFSCIDRMSDRLRFTMDALKRDRERRLA
jgi:hypothetical protein